MTHSKIQQSISGLFIVKNTLEKHLSNGHFKLSGFEMQRISNDIERIHGHILDLEERCKRLANDPPSIS